MIYAVWETADKLYIIHPLVSQMRGIVVETETLVPFHGSQSPFGACDIEGNFSRMDFKGEVYLLLFELL